MLPATKALPKEMLTVVDQPVIQYGVEEAVASGLTHVILVTAAGKGAIEDHFDSSPELERILEQKGDTAHAGRRAPGGRTGPGELRPPAASPRPGPCRAPGPRPGRGRALRRLPPGRHHDRRGWAGDRPAAARLRRGAGARALGRARPAGARPALRDAGRGAGGPPPLPGAGPGGEAVAGGGPVRPGHHGALRPDPGPLWRPWSSTGAGAGGEIQLTDGLRALLRQRPIFACEYAGRRHDCGTKLGYLRATVELALRRPDLGADFRRALEEVTGLPPG